MMLTELRLAEGEQLPRGYGVAWRLPDRLVYVCLPIPLNLIVGAFRAFWLRVRLPEGRDVLDEYYDLGHRSGYEAGRRQGYEHAMHLRLTLEEIRAEIQTIKSEL